MKAKKDIGKLFRDILEGGEKSPSSILWSQLESKLKKERRRRAIWFWSGVGFLLLLITAGLYIWVLPNSGEKYDLPEDQKSIYEKEINSKVIAEQDKTDSLREVKSKNPTLDTLKNQNIISVDEPTLHSETITNNERTKVPKSESPKPVNSSRKTLSESSLKESLESSPDAIQNSKKETTAKKLLSIPKDDQTVKENYDNIMFKGPTNKNKVQSKNSDSEFAVVKNDTLSLDKTIGTKEFSALEKPTSTIDSIQKDSLDSKKEVSLVDTEIVKNKDSVSTNEVSEKKLAFSAHIAPVYYALLQQGSILDPRLSQNTTQGQWNIGYGFLFHYKASDKLYLRFGANRIKTGYMTKNIPEFDSNNNPTDLLDYKIEAPRVVSQTQLSNLFNDTGFVDLDHELSYIEIPLEINYLFKRGKLQLAGIGGFSTWLLDTNEVFATSPSGAVFIGNATELSDISFSLNAGAGIYYNFTGNWLFTVEPVFKYQLNAFKDNPDGVNPFTFGIYTGFKLQF